MSSSTSYDVQSLINFQNLSFHRCPCYLVLAENPLVVSTLAVPTLSAPQLLMVSHTKDRLDEGSHSPRSEPLDRAGRGADGAAG